MTVNPYELPRDVNEGLRRAGLIWRLRERLNVGLDYEADLQRASGKADQPMSQHIVRLEPEDEVVPARYYQVIWGPRQGVSPVAGITKFAGRFPVTTDEIFPSLSERQTSEQPWWNDIFLEVTFEGGESEGAETARYLLNSKGIVAYESAADVIADLGFATTEDLFAVYRPQVDAPPIEVATLDYLLDEKNPDRYHFVGQD